MKRKTVSVVMATYNGSKYIGEQLRSISKQTIAPDEIIISDDGSTDDTLDIVNSLRKESSMEMIVIKNYIRLGFRDNFLYASRAAKGDFIVFCDQDDIWKKNKIEMCYKYFEDPSISMVVHSAKTIDKFSKEMGVFRQGIRSTRVVSPLSYDPWGTFWGFSITFRRELLELYPIEDRFQDYISPNYLIAHDRWIVFLGQIVGATAEISDFLVSYRQHENNLFGQGAISKMETTDDIKQRSSVYINSTLKMVDIARNIDESSAQMFPLYNKKHSINFFEKALSQLQSRNRIYISDTKLKALTNTLLLAARGGYADIHSNNMRWKSFARDLKFVICGS